MSLRNVEIVGRVVAALQRSLAAYARDPRAVGEAISAGRLPAEIQEALAFVDPSAEWHPPPEDPDAAVRIGSEAIVTYLERWLEAWEYWRVEAEPLHDAGDKVVVFTRTTGKGRASGLELGAFESAHVVTLEEGRIIRVQGFYDRDAALAAAGDSDRPGS